MRSSSSVSRVALGLGLAVLTGCSAQVATIGYEAPLQADGDVQPGEDAEAPMDANLPDDAGSDAAPAQDADPARPISCLTLPEVVNARNEAGIERVEEGPVFGATDKALGCLEAGVMPPSDPVNVNYVRNDGKPLLIGGQAYSLSAQAMVWGPLNAFADERCKQGPIPILFFLTPLGTSCVDINPVVDAPALRIPLSSPATQLPMGARLCDVSCANLPK